MNINEATAFLTHLLDEEERSSDTSEEDVVSIQPSVTVEDVVSQAMRNTFQQKYSADNIYSSETNSSFDEDDPNDPDYSVDISTISSELDTSFRADRSFTMNQTDHSSTSNHSSTGNHSNHSSTGNHSDHSSTGNHSDQPSTSNQAYEGGINTSRKRKRKPTKWKKYILKQKICHGEEHQTKSGNTIPAKRIGQPCTCKKKCFQKIGLQDINKIFSEFCQIGDKNLQDAYLFGCIKPVTVQRRRPKTGERGQYRNSSYKYTVSVRASTIEVCATAFRSIHGIGITRFKRLRKPNLITAPIDRRGQHGNQRKIADCHKLQVKDHIQSFPRRESHYSRKDNHNRVYLNECLNIKRMWLLYLEKYEPTELQKYRNGKKREMSCGVKYSYYKQIFMEEFNLSFGQPRTDTCSQCDRLQSKISASEDPHEREMLQAEKNVHLAKADKAYDLLRELQKQAANDDHTAMYTFDFQQNLPSPTLHSNDMFYCRMLWTYNFGLHDCKTQEGIMHLWDETTAMRGSSEVCSCLSYTLRKRNKNEENIVLFSDGCCGQNRNKTVMSFLLSLIENKTFKRIDHYFLCRGHTFLPNDRDFSSIEARKKVEKALVPADWVRIVKESRQVHPFQVNQMTQEDMFDYKSFAEARLKTTFTDSTGQKLKFREVMWFSYGESDVFNDTFTELREVSHPDEVWCRYTHSTAEAWKKVNVKKRLKKTQEEMTLKLKYNSPLKIKAAKKKDLVSLCEKGLMFGAEAFYLNLSASGDFTPVAQSEVDSDGDDYMY